MNMAKIIWDYAVLSKLAKAYGGPEQLMRVLVRKGYEIGIKEAKGKCGIIIAASAVAGAGICYLAIKGIDMYNKSKNNITDEEAETASQILANRIREYDRTSGIDTEEEPDISTEAADKMLKQYAQENLGGK